MSGEEIAKPISQFLRAISPWEAGYRNAGFSYHARRDGNDLLILHAQLSLRAWKDNVPNASVRFSNQEVGHFPFAEFGLSLPEFIDQFRLGGWVNSPKGRMRLFNPSGRDIHDFYQDFHQAGLTNGHRFAILRLSGGQFERSRVSPEIDWDLKASDAPYDGLWEVLTEFQLLGYSGDIAALEILAFQVAEIDMQSEVTGVMAYPSVYLSRELDRRKCRIGYRLLEKETVTRRGSIRSEEMQWSEVNHENLGVCWKGTATMSIPAAAGLHCYATYSDVAQHQYWIGDQRSFPNWRRAVYEECDSDAGELKSRLFNEKWHQNDSRVFERGMIRLLWLLGFSPINIDGKKNERAPDLLAITPGGRLMVVECTTDIIDSDKLTKLAARKAAIELRLKTSSAQEVEVMPVLVTSVSRAVLAGVEKASEMGIAVVAKEDLETAMNRALIFQNADDLFQQLAATMRPAPGSTLG